MLLKALVEAEIDGVAVSNHLAALRDAIDGLSKVGRRRRVENLRGGNVQILILEQAALGPARSFHQAAAGVLVGKDGGLRAHQPQPSRPAERMERPRGKRGGSPGGTRRKCLLTVLGSAERMDVVV